MPSEPRRRPPTPDRMLRTNPSDYAILEQLRKELQLPGGIRYTLAHIVAYANSPEGREALRTYEGNNGEPKVVPKVSAPVEDAQLDALLDEVLGR